MEIPDATIEYTIETSYSKGLEIILNPAPARALTQNLLKKLFLITPNETEAELLTGIAVTDDRTAAVAAEKLRRMGVQNVVITLGEKGAFLLTDTVSKIIPTPTATHVVDTTASGDCFNGALAVALSENKSLETAVAFACQAASISVTRLGAQASMPHRREMTKYD